jgi:hypothetical protein
MIAMPEAFHSASDELHTGEAHAFTLAGEWSYLERDR